MLSPTTVTTLPLRKGKEALAAVKREKGRERERERERERDFVREQHFVQ